MAQWIENLHLTLILLAGISVLLLFIGSEFKWAYAQHPRMMHTTLAAHFLALLSGIIWSMVTYRYPFTGIGWLTEKAVVMGIYLFLIGFALKIGRNMALRWFAFLGALGWGYYLIELTLTHYAYFI